MSDQVEKMRIPERGGVGPSAGAAARPNFTPRAERTKGAGRGAWATGLISIVSPKF